MKKWEKPVLSILGINKTKGDTFFKKISGVASFENEYTEFTEESVPAASYRKKKHKPSTPSTPSSPSNG